MIGRAWRRLLLIGAALFALVPLVAEDQSQWPAGWRLRIAATATQPAACYAMTVNHDGLIRLDGRDVRVLGPDGKETSFYLAHVDGTRFRVIIDGAAGPGRYQVFYSNLVSQILPPLPDGVSPFGRPDWSPVGGFRCISYDPIEGFDNNQLTSLAEVEAKVAKTFALVAAATATEAEKQPDASQRRVFQLSSFVRSTDVDLGSITPIELLRDVHMPASKVPQNWFHIFRAQIEVRVAGAYEFQIAGGKREPRLAVMFLDGDYTKPVIRGWFIKTVWGPQNTEANAKVELTAGKHVLELYTTRSNPQLEWMRAGESGLPRHLNGLDAHFDDCVELAVGEPGVKQGTLAEVFVGAVRHWAREGRYPLARSIARVGQARFASDAATVKALAAAYEQAEQSAFADNWLVEGKYPSRTGAVATDFPPPFSIARSDDGTMKHDERHVSSTVWAEKRLIYGLPFDVQQSPWAVTSGVCAADDTLYAVTKDGVVHAVTISTGIEKWTFPSGGACLGSPLLYRDKLYVATLDGRIYAIDAQRGRMLWNYPTMDWIEGSLCADDGRIYGGSRDRHLYAIDAALGVERWRLALDGEIVATPTVDGGSVFVGTRAGTFFAVDAATGTVRWTYAVKAAVVGGACVGKGRVSFGDVSGRVHSLDVATGRLAWAEPVAVGGPVMAAPILVGTVLFGGCDDAQLWGLRLEDGLIGWRATMPGNGGIARQPLFANETLVFTSHSRNRTGLGKDTPGGRGATVSFVRGAPPVPNLFRPNAPIAIDGQLGEPDWATAPRLPGFLTLAGMSIGDPIVAKVLWDGERLLISAVCQDDAGGDAGRSLTVQIDPQGEGVSYDFIVTPTARSERAADDAAWKPEWTSAATSTSAGWTVEIAIPVTGLPKAAGGAPKNGSKWKLNLIVAAAGKGRETTPRIWNLTTPVAEAPTSRHWPLVEFTDKPVPQEAAKP